ncbi:hypothetical protein FPQ18DRAFT_341436 [Pyronema domesticum]|nr:hypothetical protein FPQ18DRAFT_341436 [Pyronema domesticum]
MLLNSPPTITFVQRSISDESDDEIEEEKHTIVSSTSADEMEYLLRMVFKRPMSSTFRLWIDTKTSGDVNFTLRQLAEEFHRIAKEDKGKEINRLHLTLWECVVDEVRVEWANERTKAMQPPSIITFLTPNFTPTGRKLCSCFSSSPTFTSAAALETALLGSFIHIGKMGPITRIWITTKDGRKIDVTLTELAEQVSRTSKDGLRVVDASGLWGFGVYEVWLS